MTEAVCALTDFGFQSLHASAIQAAHATWNHASRRVLEKSGFQFVRHVSEGFQKHGRWVEENLFSITREEWNHRTEQGSGLNDYPPSRPVLGRCAPGTGRAVEQS
jgi:ribosomal-protein-alanine N-acetyltransferase